MISLGIDPTGRTIHLAASGLITLLAPKMFHRVEVG